MRAQAREARDHRRPSSRRLRTARSRRDQEAGGRRAEIGHRRRIPPRLVADRLPRGARRRRMLRGRAGVPVPRRDAAADPAARQQEARRLHAASDDRALQVRAGAHPGDAEDDDPLAVDAALPLRPQGRCRRRSIRRWTTSTAISARPGARPCAPSPTPAAAICSSTRPISPICAIPKLRPQVKARGDDPDKLPFVYAGMINAAISDIPADMTITMHLCRGNFRSTFISAGGGYEPIAEMLFNTIKVHGYFMEYDTDALRRLRAAALRAEGQDRRARACHLQERHARKPRRDQAPDRRGREVRRHSTSSACRRNAASPPPRRATSSPRRSSGRSSA